MINDLVSIIMPTWNCGKYIADSINSVINQTYKKWELIIVDDCSTDNTLSIVKSFNDERIIYIKNDNNLGAALSRNKAIDISNGQFIAFLDSDDLWDKYKLEKQIKFMKNNNYNFSYTCYEEIDDIGNKLKTIITGPKKITKMGMYNYCWPGCLTVMYNQDFVGKIKIANLAKNNDYAMWLKIIKKTNCYLLDETLASYRIRKGSISHSKITTLIKHHYYLFRKGEEKCAFTSIILTINNIFYGCIKKVFYKRRVK